MIDWQILLVSCIINAAKYESYSTKQPRGNNKKAAFIHLIFFPANANLPDYSDTALAWRQHAMFLTCRCHNANRSPTRERYRRKDGRQSVDVRIKFCRFKADGKNFTPRPPIP